MKTTKNMWEGLRKALMGPPPDPKPLSMNHLTKAFYNQTIQPYQNSFANQIATLADYANANTDEKRKERAMNQRQEELIKLILAGFVEKAGGEIIIPLATLEAMENKHILIEDDQGAGCVKIHLLPPEVMEGIEAARKEAAEEEKRRAAEKIGTTLKQVEDSMAKYKLYDPLGTATASGSSFPPGYFDDHTLKFGTTLRSSADAAEMINRVKKGIADREAAAKK